MRLLKKVFIPHHSNNYHPYSTRHYVLIAFSILLLILNFWIFPIMGVNSGSVLASNIDLNELITLANKERAAKNLGALKNNTALARAALAKGNDMIKKQYWSHFGPNNESPWDFILGAGYDYVYAGENLAKDFSTALDTHLAWMKSPTHRSNIMNANFREVGLAIVSGKLNGKNTTIIVQMFGSTVMGTNTATPKPTTKVTTPTATSTPSPTPTIISTPTPTTNVVTPTPSIATPSPTPDITSLTPEITSPEDGSILNNANIELKGNADIGDTIMVYSNGKLLGELPKGGNPFTVNIKLLEEQNSIYIKSKNAFTANESMNSDTVNVRIDKIPPDLSKIYITLYEANEGTLIEIRSEEELANVDIEIDYELKSFMTKDANFYFLLSDKTITAFKIIFYDNAGNSATKDVDLSKEKLKTTNIPAVPGVTSKSGSNFWSDIFSKIGQRELINICIISLVLGLILLDASTILKNGIRREFYSHQSFHFALILICIVGIVTL